jgi:uncharacterized protein YndB with AHSA1/START domain
VKTIILAALLMLAPIETSAATLIANDSFHDANGGRVLRESVIVDATLAQAWAAFTTDQGFTRWAVALAHIVPGNGGSIEFALAKDGRIGDPSNVRHRIDVFQPDQMLIFHNEFVPAGGPIDAALFPTVRTILTFDAVAPGKTRVTETVVGFGGSAAYDGLYAHLRDGNAEYLTMLADSFHTNN